MRTYHMLCLSTALSSLVLAQPLRAQATAGQASADAAQAASAPHNGGTEAEGQAQQEIVITARDHAGLIERRPTSTVFGLDKPLLETPRSASFATALTLDRYGVQTITDLVAVTPGAATASWYGVPGSLNIRGTLSDNYFRGFQRIQNYGTYATPLGAASEVQVVRGPPSAVYGQGKIGGFVNFVPKTAQTADLAFLDHIEGQIEGTLGSYSKTNVNGQLGVPVALGGVRGGLFGYAEVEDSDSYFVNAFRKHQLFQGSGVFDLGSDISLTFGGMYYHYRGARPSVNRVTQALVDNGTYVTGRDLTLVDLDNNGRLTPNEAGGPVAFDSLYSAVTAANIPARNTLDTGVGTTTLSHHIIFWDKNDFSVSRTHTYYGDLAKKLGDAANVKLQLFYDDLDHKRANTYGVPAQYNSKVGEARLSADFKLEAGDTFTSQNVVGASFRKFRGLTRETYNSAFLGFDRRDLSFGATATDTFDSPFTTEPGNIGVSWETQIRTHYTDAGIFGVSDTTLFRIVDVTLNGRYDWYDVHTRDEGSLVTGGVVPNQYYHVKDGDFTYSASISLKLPYHLLPYFTYADSSALEVNQGGAINPRLILQNAWLSGSKLQEAGLKFQLFGGTLVGSFAAYRQTRTQVNSISNTVAGTRAKGLELELRWLATKNFSFTFTGNTQKTMVRGPDNGYTYLPAYYTNLPGALTYGGNYVVYRLSSLIGTGDYKYTLIPDEQASLFGTYTSNDLGWGRFGATAGVIYTGDTKIIVPNGVDFHDRAIVNASAYVGFGNTTVTVGVTNAFNKIYFQTASDAFANWAAIPGVGREWRITARQKF